MNDHRSATPVASPSIRLTRRGRAALVLLVAALLLTAFSLGRTASEAADARGGMASAPAPEQTTVQAGESLWSVAQRVAPENDPREVIAQIQRLNDLDGAQLQVGQLLLLPTAA